LPNIRPGSKNGKTLYSAKIDKNGNLKAGAEVGGYAGKVDFKFGFNIAGWNIGIDLGAKLGASVGLGFENGGPKVSAGIFDLGVTVGKAPDTTPP
jgi:hypothetical protein